MGFAMANQMGNAFTGTGQQNQQSGASGPPPIPPSIAFHVVINGQQTGPFDVATLKTMAGQNQLTKEMLVWKEGMSGWTAAGQVNELKAIFGSIPPPIPQ